MGRLIMVKSREDETYDALANEFGDDRMERELFEIAISLGRIVDMLAEMLPSANPKKGKWIPHVDEYGEHYGDDCSECGEWYVMPYGKLRICPNCGARMDVDALKKEMEK